MQSNPYAHRHHLLSHLRRLRSRCHRTRHGIGRPRPRHPFHQLRPADSHESQRPAHPLPRSRSRLLPALRPSALHAGACHKNARGFRIRSAGPFARALRDSHSVSALLARSMAAPRRLPFITTLHGTDITLVGSNRSYLPITKFSIEQSDGVTAISKYLLDQTVREFDIKRPIEVIPNFVNCDLYVRRPNPEQRAKWAPGGEPILMHLSNFRPVKRITDTIEIFAQVRAKMPAKLVLIGDGPDRGTAEYLVRKKKLQKDVHFLGKQDQVYRLLSDADLFLLPSQLESFGLAALEAMACEVPVIATNVGGIPEVIEHRVDGYLVQPGEVSAAAKYAIDLLSRADRGREMGQLARINAKKKFCANDVIPSYERYYQRVLSETRAASA